MDTLDFNTLRRSAFRTLGLSGAATQEQIESAARMMRLYDGGEVPPTPRDAHWLGPVPRSLPDIDAALTRLTDPESRVQERIWWYAAAPPGTDSPRPLRAGASATERACHRHDEALTALLSLLIAGNDGAALIRWRELLTECQEIAHSDEYLQWMLAVENEGAFEKSATLEEVARWQGDFADRTSTALVALADERLVDGDFRGAGRVLNTLREAAADDPGKGSRSIDRILNRFDDMLIGQCNEQVALVDEAWKTKRIDRLKPACIRALNACEDKLTPLADELAGQLNDPYRAARVRGQLVTVYVHVADAYEACHDKFNARGALIKSLPMAQDTPMEPRIRQRIDALTGVAPVAPAQLSSRNAGTRTDIASSGGYRNYSSGGRRGLVVILVLVASAIFRMCALSGNSRSSTSYDVPSTHLTNQQINDLLGSQNATQPSTAPMWVIDDKGNAVPQGYSREERERILGILNRNRAPDAPIWTIDDNGHPQMITPESPAPGRGPGTPGTPGRPPAGRGG